MAENNVNVSLKTKKQPNPLLYICIFLNQKQNFLAYFKLSQIKTVPGSGPAARNTS